MSTASPWRSPAPGDIVWCMFPEIPDIEPGSKPRPALVMGVDERTDGVLVRVVYGTSQRVNRLNLGEVAITQTKYPAAYTLAGLAYDTKFDFKIIIELPWTERYFKAPPRAVHGNTPKIGTLHATVIRAVETAYREAIAR